MFKSQYVVLSLLTRVRLPHEPVSLHCAGSVSTVKTASHRVGKWPRSERESPQRVGTGVLGMAGLGKVTVPLYEAEILTHRNGGLHQENPMCQPKCQHCPTFL